MDDCVAALSGRVQDAHRPEAVGHLLGEAPVDRGGVGELGCVEERRQVPWKQAGCIVGAGEADAILDRDESAPDDDPAAAPERPAVLGDAQLVLVGEEQLELELRVAEERGKAYEPVEDVLDASAPRRAVNRKGRRGSRKARSVPVPAWLMEIVATSLPLRGRLFPDVTANGLRSAMSDLCERLGLAHCTPHRLRHRRISLWHFQGVPARELADRAGHSKPSMSLDVYSHMIVPDEVDPDALKAILLRRRVAPEAAAVMHR